MGQHHPYNLEFFRLTPYNPNLYPAGEIAGFLYPALVEQPENRHVRIGFEKDQRFAEELNKKGILYLYIRQFTDQYKALKKMCTTTLSGPSSIWLMSLGKTRKEVVERLLDVILFSLFGPISGEIIDEKIFSATIQKIQSVASIQPVRKSVMNSWP